MDGKWGYIGICGKTPRCQSLGIGRSNGLTIRFHVHRFVVGWGHPWSRLFAWQQTRPWRFEKCMWGLILPFFSAEKAVFQPNILIDAKGAPRLSDFALSSITKNIGSVNASTPNHGLTIRYCAPELLDVVGAVMLAKRKPTNKSDVYSLSMVIVEARLFPEVRRIQVLIAFTSSLQPERCPCLNIRTLTSPF